MRFVAALAALFAIAGPAAGEVYRWTDAAGGLHFSQQLDQVPPEQRAAARASAARAERVEEASEPRVEVASTPAPQRRARASVVRIPFERRGTLMLVTARVDDRLDVPFLVDTGASSVSLPRRAADALGIAISPSTPRDLVSTANGVVSMPVVTLASVELAGARVEGLEAHVNDSMEIGLLGGAFFNHFVYGVDAAAGELTLTQNEGMRSGLRQEEWQSRFRALRVSLAELDAYLEGDRVLRAGRRAAHEAKSDELRARLQELEEEATRRQVPAAWQE
jgi:clan AA aspartic protease (TIGR02281 family)